MKKIRLGFLFFCVLTLASCSFSPTTNPSSDEQQVLQNSMNETISVCDAEDKVIDKIEHYGSVTQTDDGFIYSKLSECSKLSENSEDTHLEMEYYRYDFSKNKSIKLGSIEDWAYTAFYDTIYSNNHIYMLVTTGDIFFDESTNYLYDIDLSENVMSFTVLETGDSPYNFMTLIGNKILIATPGRETCYINEYDIQSKSLSTIGEYDDPIRHISSDEQYVYLLRLKMETETNARLYVDVYDWNMELITSIDVTAAIFENVDKVLEPEDANNELRQLVSHFDVNNGYVYYQNFCVTRALFELQPVNTNGTDKEVAMKQVVKASSKFSKATNATENNSALVSYYETCDNSIFILDTHSREIKQYNFFAENRDYYITDMTQNSKGEVLIFLNYKDPQTGEKLPPKVYFFNISDLEKQN